MATVIRFARHGTKKRPFYRIVVQDHRSPRDGKFIENIGTLDPRKGDSTLKIERPRLEYWLGCGAQMSESVASKVKILRKQWGLSGETVEKQAAPAGASDKPKASAKAPKTSKAKSKEA